jgi:predicted transcriptional regulator
MGALTVRLPESLHDRLREIAEQEGISMNQFVMLATAEKVSALDARSQLEYLENRGERAKQESEEGQASPEARLRSMLDRAPDREPPEEDRPSDE